MHYTPDTREEISAMLKGQQIESFTWEEEGAYWVMTFTGGAEMCVRLMAEIAQEGIGHLD